MAISPLSSPSRGVPEMLAQRRKPQSTSLQGTGKVMAPRGTRGRWEGVGGGLAHCLLHCIQPEPSRPQLPLSVPSTLSFS